jgi:multiple sugar transport system permease protein
MSLQNKKGTDKKHISLSRKLNQEHIAGYIFILPFIIGFLCFTILPILASLVLSFTKYDVLSPPKFIGLTNYAEMFIKDPLFWKSLGVTFYYTLVSVPLRLFIALMIAMLFVRSTKASYIYRAVFYLPSIIGGSVAVAVLWKNIFAMNGVINSLLMSIGINSRISWLGRTDTAIWVLIILAVWQFGSPMLIFLSALKQIPVSFYEAARVDGASRIKQFYKITLPMLTPVIFFNLIMQLINGFIAFTQCFIITGGEPLDSTLFYAVYMYRRSFTFYQMGYGSAMAWLMLLIVGLLTVLIFKTSNKWVYYEAKVE